MAYKQKGWSPFTKKTDPVKKPVGPVTPSTKAEYMERQVWNEIEKQKRKKKKKKSDEDFDNKYNRARSRAISIGSVSSIGGKKKKKTPLKKVTDPPNDGDVKMTKKQERKHRRKVHQYNKNVAKPLNETQKKKIQQQLKGMDPKDPEAKLLRKMLNLKKNR